MYSNYKNHSTLKGLLAISPNSDRLTPQEMLMKRIAWVRIHVERTIERIKKFKIISRTIPIALKPVISQLVHMVGFLVNYQQPIDAVQNLFQFQSK